MVVSAPRLSSWGQPVAGQMGSLCPSVGASPGLGLVRGEFAWGGGACSVG